VSTGGLAGDAGAAVGDGDGGDGGSVGPGDGTTGADGVSGGDGSVVEASAMPFCASLSPKPKYCADFDTGSISDDGNLDGLPTIDPAVSKSPPASLLAVVEVNASGRGAKVTRDFIDTPASFAVAFDILVDEYDASHDVELVAVQLTRSGTQVCLFDASVRGNQWTIDESCQDGATRTVEIPHRSSISLMPSRWTHVAFSVVFGATRTLTLTIDGQSAYTSLALDPATASGTAALSVGINYLQTAATIRTKLHMDNVTFDYP
jgi:hypothetical protein